MGPASRGRAGFGVRPSDHDPEARALAAERDGVDRVLVALSSALGIEALPAEEAEPLLALHNEGILALGAPFGLWGAVALSAPRAAAVDEVIDAGAVGVSLPAGGLRRDLAPVLDRLEERDAPLFVHPGPAAAGHRAPAWWPALTAYVADMSAAWLALAAGGRARHPRLRVIYAMLAGGAPLHVERLAARGGPAGAVHDRLAWFDTSSYGPRAVDAMLRIVGVDRLVHGSDRPVVGPAASELGEVVDHALRVTNPAAALQVGVPA